MPDEQQTQPNVIDEEPIGVVFATEPPATIDDPRERTRRFIAVALTILFAIMITLFLVRILAPVPPLTSASLDAFKTVLAIVAGIFGTIIGFYFGSQT